MNKTLKRLLEVVCMGSFLLAVLGCENADGSLNAAWTLPLLALTGISGGILNASSTHNNKQHHD